MPKRARPIIYDIGKGPALLRSLVDFGVEVLLAQ